MATRIRSFAERYKRRHRGDENGFEGVQVSAEHDPQSGTNCRRHPHEAASTKSKLNTTNPHQDDARENGLQIMEGTDHGSNRDAGDHFAEVDEGELEETIMFYHESESSHPSPLPFTARSA